MNEIVIIQISREEMKALISEAVERALQQKSEITVSSPPNYPDALTIEQTSKFTGLSVSTIYSLVCRREIPNYKPGKRLMFRKAELEEWLKGKRRFLRAPEY